MNTSFEKGVVSSDEWYTPLEIISALGRFDLDPAAPEKPLWKTAEDMWDKNYDGLSHEWYGRVWLNPPYSRPLIEQFMRKMAEHNNGIALLFNRCDNKLFREYVLDKAKSILFLKSRIKFYRADGTRGGSPGCGNILVAYGDENDEILRKCALEGSYVKIVKR